MPANLQGGAHLSARAWEPRRKDHSEPSVSLRLDARRRGRSQQNTAYSSSVWGITSLYLVNCVARVAWRSCLRARPASSKEVQSPRFRPSRQPTKIVWHSSMPSSSVTG